MKTPTTEQKIGRPAIGETRKVSITLSLDQWHELELLQGMYTEEDFYGKAKSLSAVLRDMVDDYFKLLKEKSESLV